MSGQREPVSAPMDQATTPIQNLFADMPKSVEFGKLRKRLLRQVETALNTYHMHEVSGRWLVALSGGKDSYGLLAILLELQARGVLKQDILACNLDQGQPNFPKEILPNYLESLGVAHRIEYRDTYSVVTDKVPEGNTYCALCSRLRRGHLYRIAREEGCSAVVLGHHRDDVLETFLLNMFFGGKMATMPPKLINDEGDLAVLRPLSLCEEQDLQKFADGMLFPIIPCDLCGSQDGLQRQMMKQMLADMERKSPGRKDRMFAALQNVNASHLLDPKLFDFS